MRLSADSGNVCGDTSLQIPVHQLPPIEARSRKIGLCFAPDIQLVSLAAGRKAGDFSFSAAAASKSSAQPVRPHTLSRRDPGYPLFIETTF